MIFTLHYPTPSKQVNIHNEMSVLTDKMPLRVVKMTITKGVFVVALLSLKTLPLHEKDKT
jgi:hypothetical protein